MFDTPNKKAQASEILKQGLSSEFWILVKEALKESRDSLGNQLESDEMAELPADQYKLKCELLKAKRKYLDILSNTPENIISWLQTPDNSSVDFDPYSTKREV